MLHPPDPVTSVVVVCNLHCRVAALPRAMDTISEFVDHSVRWSLPGACGFDFQGGALRLAQRVMMHEAVEAERAAKIIEKEKTEKSKSNSKNTTVRHDANAVLTLRKRDDKFFRQRYFTLSLARAAARGDLRLMQWLVGQFPGCYVTLAVEEAAKNGHLHVLKWLHRPDLAGQPPLNVFWGSRELFYAGQNGHLDVVNWLQDHLLHQLEQRAVRL